MLLNEVKQQQQKAAAARAEIIATQEARITARITAQVVQLRDMQQQMADLRAPALKPHAEDDLVAQC